MTDETLTKVPEVSDAADQPSPNLAKGALRAAGLPAIEDAEPGEPSVVEAATVREEEPQTQLDGESLGLVMAAKRGFTPRARQR